MENNTENLEPTGIEISKSILEVSEMFYSLQGEGLRVGTANVFIRLQGCKAKHSCFSMGIKCDTEFESGKPMTLEQIYSQIGYLGEDCKNIIWTGGEPAQQLTTDIVQYFKDLGYFQAIETSGLLPVPWNLDYIAISPKVAEHVIKKNFQGYDVDELRYVRHKGQTIPQPAIKATHYYVSPHSDGNGINAQNLGHCIQLCKDFPKWKLSVQMHKIINVL